MTSPDSGPDAATRRGVVERVTMTGELDPDRFLPWIGRYASKLGLGHAVVLAGRSRIELDVAGEAELIEMLTIGCSLGPRGVQVDTVEHDGRCPAPKGTLS